MAVKKKEAVNDMLARLTLRDLSLVLKCVVIGKGRGEVTEKRCENCVC
jgi:hypothetical protein